MEESVSWQIFYWKTLKKCAEYLFLRILFKIVGFLGFIEEERKYFYEVYLRSSLEKTLSWKTFVVIFFSWLDINLKKF